MDVVRWQILYVLSNERILLLFRTRLLLHVICQIRTLCYVETLNNKDFRFSSDFTSFFITDLCLSWAIRVDWTNKVVRMQACIGRRW